MSDLIPCSNCRRHFRVRESACPFCAEAVAAPVPVAPRLVTQMTRAALFAGAVLLVPACGGQQKPAEKIDPMTTADAGPGGAVKKTDGNGEEDEMETREEIADPEDWRGNRTCGPDGNCPPYGAPPSPDDRIV